jgi:hypothetical protein
VRYVREAPDRRAFIDEYFGVAAGARETR